MTAPTGDDADSRFTAALDRFLQDRQRGTGDGARRDVDWSRDLDDPADGAGRADGDDAATDVYELPEIVPATVDVPVAPQLPPRAARVAPAVVPTGPVSSPEPIAARAAQPVAAATPADTAWGGAVPTRAARPTAQLRATGRRPRVRRVTRVVRHVDPWSVFKVALIFSGVAYLVALTSGVLLWRVADSTGTLDNVERWFTQFGWETFELKGDEVFSNAWVIGLFAAVGLTGTAVLMATLFNLVSDIVGGVRITVLEEEVVERTASSARRYVVRRPPLAETAGAAASWDVDDEAPVGPPEAVTAPTPSPTAASAATRRATTGSTDWSIDD